MPVNALPYNALSYNGTSWSAPTDIDGSSGSVTNGGPVSVSCVSSTFCIAVDGDGNAIVGKRG
jgi:hypothetical protein